MNVIGQPSAYSLSSMMSDFVVSSDEDIQFEVRLSDKTILKEVYSPDTDNMIYIRGRALGKTLQKYLYGNDFEESVQENIAKQFTVLINNVEYGTYNILKSRFYTDLPSANFFDGSVFLNLFEKVKWTTPDAKEYLTCVLGILVNFPVTANVIYRDGNSYTESGLKNYYVSNSGKFETFDVSFATVAAKFPEINKQNIVAYKIHTKNQINTYYVDRESYLLPLQFIYKNGFDVPDSINTRGIATRKGGTTYDTSKIHDIIRKSNVKRTDTFTVSSGRIYSVDDYDRYRDMFNSGDVRIFFKGKYRKIVITEENATEPLRKGNLPAIGFSFQFADEYENNILLGTAFYEWILEHGQWVDTNMWMDNGQWIDEPEVNTEAMKILMSLT